MGKVRRIGVRLVVISSCAWATFHRRRGLRVVLVAASVLICAPQSALAGCGGTESSQTTHHVTGQLPPLAIGDSTMLLSLPGLAAAGFDANAHGCRSFAEGLQLLSQIKDAGQLPHLVLIALGANNPVTSSQITAALALVGPTRLLVLVTHRNNGGGADADRALELHRARSEPGRMVVLDWVAHSRGQPEWFDPDGLHLLWPGVYAFTAFLATVMPYAYAPCPTGA